MNTQKKLIFFKPNQIYSSFTETIFVSILSASSSKILSTFNFLLEGFWHSNYVCVSILLPNELKNTPKTSKTCVQLWLWRNELPSGKIVLIDTELCFMRTVLNWKLIERELWYHSFRLFFLFYVHSNFHNFSVYLLVRTSSKDFDLIKVCS